MQNTEAPKWIEIKGEPRQHMHAWAEDVRVHRT